MMEAPLEREHCHSFDDSTLYPKNISTVIPSIPQLVASTFLPISQPATVPATKPPAIQGRDPSVEKKLIAAPTTAPTTAKTFEALLRGVVHVVSALLLN